MHSAGFTRVADVLQLPAITSDIDTIRTDARKLLDVRDSDECRQYRHWLFEADDVSDAQIQKRFAGVRPKLGAIVHSSTGRVIRWAIGNGLGFVRIVGPASGEAVSAVDTFLLERVLPSRGALTFPGEKYESIFKP